MTRDEEDFEQSELSPTLKQGHFIDLVCGDCHPLIFGRMHERYITKWLGLPAIRVQAHARAWPN